MVRFMKTFKAYWGKVVAVEPDVSAVPSGEMPRPHKIQDIGAEILNNVE